MRFIQGLFLCPLLLPVLPFMVLAAIAAAFVFATQWLLVRAGVGEFDKTDGYENAYHQKF